MRPKERIYNFLNKVNWQSLAERWDVDVELFNQIRNKVGSVRPSIQSYWLKEPDLRFGQMLINLQVLPDKLRIWMDEEHDILKDQGLLDREVMFWGRTMDENKNPLPKIEWILIKYMSTDHIKAILRDVKEHRMAIRSDYKKAFENELALRETEVSTETDVDFEEII